MVFRGNADKEPRMRAIVAEKLGSPEDLVIREVAAPTPGPGEVAVDLKAAAVNFADLLVI